MKKNDEIINEMWNRRKFNLAKAVFHSRENMCYIFITVG